MAFEAFQLGAKRQNIRMDAVSAANPDKILEARMDQLGEHVVDGRVSVAGQQNSQATEHSQTDQGHNETSFASSRQTVNQAVVLLI